MSRKELAATLRPGVRQENPPGKAAKKFLKRVFNNLNVAFSIQSKILLALCVVILMMSITNVWFVSQVVGYSRQYDAIITNITTANTLSSSFKTDIDTEMWKIVAGKISFQEGKQYQLVSDANIKIQWMVDNTTSQRARIKLSGIQRTLQTLTGYIDQMKLQKEANSPTSENEAVLEKIYFTTGVVEDVVQDYLLYEVQRTEQQYQDMRAGFNRWRYLYIALMALAVGFSVMAAWGISRSIYIPIKKLHDVTKTLTKND